MGRDTIQETRYLNAGCGYHYSKDPLWTNIDFVSTGQGVRAHNLLQGIPFHDSSFDLVYHSHVLEHFSKNDAVKLLGECYRVLRPGGVLRIAVPDLERIARSYIHWLEKGLSDPQNEITRANHTWLLLEMYDQTVRNTSGGEMAKYLYQDRIINEDFVYERIGQEGRGLREGYLYNEKMKLNKNRSYKTLIKSILKKIKNAPKLLRSRSIYTKIGRFRMEGEIHQWMYDRYSLAHLLNAAGFEQVTVRDAFTSYIEDWSRFELDGMNGITRKPDSLFIEARKK